MAKKRRKVLKSSANQHAEMKRLRGRPQPPLVVSFRCPLCGGPHHRDQHPGGGGDRSAA